MKSVTRTWFLASLSFLFGFLLILSPTPSALAVVDCDARPNHPQCGGGGEPTPQGLVLRGNNEFIGEVASYDSDNVRVFYRGDPAAAPFFAQYPLVILWLRFNRDETPNTFWLSEPSVFFESTACSGPAYLQIDHDPLVRFGVPYRLNVRELPGGGQVIYVPVDLTETPAPVTINSGLSGNSFCQTFSPSQERNVTSAVAVSENFSGPYTVGF